MATMRIDEEFTVAADAATVRHMMADPEWVSMLAAQLRATAELRNPGTPDEYTRLMVPSPQSLTAFMGPTFQVDQRLIWHEGSDNSADITANVVGMPARFRGTLVLDGDADSTHVTVGGDFEVRIPLVGNVIERKAAPKVRAILAAQKVAAAKWLSAR